MRAKTTTHLREARKSKPGSLVACMHPRELEPTASVSLDKSHAASEEWTKLRSTCSTTRIRGVPESESKHAMTAYLN